MTHGGQAVAAKTPKKKALKFAALTLVFFCVLWVPIWSGFAFVFYDAGWVHIEDLANWEWQRRAAFMVTWVMLAFVSALLACDLGDYE